MKKIAFLILYCCFLLSASAQYYTNRNKIWTFGNNAVLDFASGIPVAFTSGMASYEACASVCNVAGSLLFYTSGKIVYNRFGAVMPGGASIVPFGTGSATQGALIVPFINDPNKYYIFSAEERETGGGRVAYSVVDVTLAGGLGDVVAGSSGIVINTLMTEKMMAIPGSACNVWVMTHKKDSATFYAYEVTSAGVSTAPVISHVGTYAGVNMYEIGVMKCSPDRQKIITVNHSTSSGVELFDFNPSSGIVSNCRLLEGNQFYGAEFSPGSTKVYASGNTIYQWDVSLPTATAIIASKTAVCIASPSRGDMKLSPDGKIYIVKGFTGAHLLDCINFPEAAGGACGYAVDAVDIAPNTNSWGLPNLVWNAVSISGPTTICTGSTAIFTASSAGGTWNSSDPAVATISSTGVVIAVAPGTAIVSYATGTCNGSVTITVVTTPTLSTAVVCVGNTLALVASTGAGTWTSGSTGIAAVGPSTGIVTGMSTGTALVTYNGPGCPAVTTVVTVNSLSMGTGGTVCVGSSIVISGSPAGGTWSSSNVFATVSPMGIVTGAIGGTSLISYSTGLGCYATAVVTINSTPSISGGSGCVGSTTTLSTSIPGGTWSSSAPGIATVSPTGIATGLSGGSALITYSSPAGCTNTFTIWISTPIVTNRHLCVGSADTLISSSPGTWSSSNTGVATVGPSSGIVTTVAAGTAIISYTTFGPCPDLTNVTVDPLPASIAGPAIVIPGSSITLTCATPGGTWSSSDITKASVNSTGKVTGVTLGSVTIYYTIPTGCKVSVLINVVKNTAVDGIRDTTKTSPYPNPATNEITINVKSSAFTSFGIYNALGQELMKNEITSLEMKVNVSVIPPGEYQVIFSGDGVREMTRFVKW
jgi:uncharacterized protein YjdB